MKRGFTLLELIIVIIIVGILASVGLYQYSGIVEKSRLVEAKIRIGTMRQFAYQYYLEKGSMLDIMDSDVGADNQCSSSNFFKYRIPVRGQTYVNLAADRCVNGGKPPNAVSEYVVSLTFYPKTGKDLWYCSDTDNGSSCFGLPGRLNAYPEE